MTENYVMGKGSTGRVDVKVEKDKNYCIEVEEGSSVNIELDGKEYGPIEGPAKIEIKEA
jgi:hypothetical protein